jgi:hypothetical protein
MEIEHIKNRGITFWSEKIGPLFPTLWSGHEFGQGSRKSETYIFAFADLLLDNSI